MDAKGGLSLQKKSFIGKKKDVKVTTQGEVEGTEDYKQPFYSMPAYHTDLFPPGSPKSTDVNQQSIGNCFLLASLLAMINTEAGRVFIHGLMRDIGPDDETKAINDANPAWVVVRLYEHKAGSSSHTYLKKYIKVKKCIQVDLRGKPVFQSGPLWVHVLIAAWAHFDKSGFFVEVPSFKSLEGGRCNFVFKMLTGRTGPIHEIMDFSRPEVLTETQRNHGANVAMLSQTLTNPTSAASPDVLMKVFGGNTANRDAYVKWLTDKQRKFGKKPEEGAKLLGDEITRPGKKLRREDVKALFRDWGPNAGTTAVMNWIEKNSVLPGKRSTKQYTPYDVSVFQLIEQQYKMGRPVCLSTRPATKPDNANGNNLGASGEEMVKGLARGHAYAVCGVEKDQDGEYWITVRNPWGSYGRSYSDDGKAIPNADGSPMSRLKLADVMKWFMTVEVGDFKLDKESADM